MLLGRVAGDHSHDVLAVLGKGHVLVGQVVAGLDEGPRDDVHRAAAEHQPEEAFGRLVEVAGKHLAFDEGRVGHLERYRVMRHGGRPWTYGATGSGLGPFSGYREATCAVNVASIDN